MIEIDEHPEELRGEQPPSDDLPRGLAIVTFEHDDLESVTGLLVAEPQVREEAPSSGAARRWSVAPTVNGSNSSSGGKELG